MRLDSLPPILGIENSVPIGIICANGDTLCGWFSRLVGAEFECIGDVVLDIVGNSTNVLEFKCLTRVHFLNL
jgi:hypothetical protein